MTRYRIRELRLQRGLSQSDLARAAGIAAHTVLNYEHGRHEAMPETLDRLAVALGVKPEELVEPPAP
jgi:transcriptional regulator with XRE-family HTH domain